MKNNIINIALASALGVSPVVFAEGHKHDDFSFTAQSIESLKLNALLVVDDTQFVFNNELLNKDWDNFFALHAPALEDKKELILHWAGYTSINPKIILALIEQQSGLLSNPDADFAAPLIGLSDEQGFDAQVEDLVTKLSQRFYAYKQWQDSQVTAITSKYTSTAISNQASSNSSTAATAALVSVFKKRNKLAVDQDIVNHSNDDLTVFFGHF